MSVKSAVLLLLLLQSALQP